MKKLLIFLVGFVFSCQSSFNCQLENIDKTISSKIVDRFTQTKPNLWVQSETKFYQNLEQMNFLKKDYDKDSAIIELGYHLAVSGYTNGFFFNLNDATDIELVSDLEKIGFSSEDESAHQFLYSTINPTLTSCSIDPITYSKGERELIYGFGLTNPDSLSISFSLTHQNIVELITVDDLERPGLKKLLTVFYLSKMIKGKY